VSDNEAVFNALVHMDDVNEWLEMELEADDVDTLGGYVYSHLGKMPVSGDEFEVDNVNFSVVSTVGRRIKKVRVVKREAGSPNGQSAGDQ
jgi:CBS domain containing-hemolysin-like protein